MIHAFRSLAATLALAATSVAGGSDFYDCGLLIPEPGCVAIFQTSQGAHVHLDNLGGFQVGDHVEVIGTLISCTAPCGNTGFCVIGATLAVCAPGPAGDPFCFGDSVSGTSCPCGNQAAVGSDTGCVNSSGVGARLETTGTRFFSFDDLGFTLSGGRANQPSLLLQGESQQVLPFKDGIYCLGNPTERVEVIALDASGNGASQASIITGGNLPGPGITRYYQQWYRDPQLSPCGTGSNFSNAVQVDWI